MLYLQIFLNNDTPVMMTEINPNAQIPSADMTFKTELAITENVLSVFGELSKDYNPLHTNKEFSAKKGFSDKVAYGNILSLMISKLVGMDLWSQDVMLVSQTVNYLQPVYVGDTILLSASVKYISESVNIVELKLSFTNQKGDVCASGKCSVKVI